MLKKIKKIKKIMKTILNKIKQEIFVPTIIKPNMIKPMKSVRCGCCGNWRSVNKYCAFCLEFH